MVAPLVSATIGVASLGISGLARSSDFAPIWLTWWLGDATGALIYRWPGSPMRIAVEIDPGRDEGSLAIELASEREIALPEGPHPALGAVFTRTG